MTDPSIFKAIDTVWKSNIITTNTQYLADLSHKLEAEAAAVEGGTIYVGCQYLSLLRPYQSVYNALAEKHDVYLYAMIDMDTDHVSERITLVPLNEESQLLKEWFVIVNAPDYQKAIIAREISAATEKRIFQGIMVNDPQFINEIQMKLKKNRPPMAACG